MVHIAAGHTLHALRDRCSANTSASEIGNVGGTGRGSRGTLRVVIFFFTNLGGYATHVLPLWTWQPIQRGEQTQCSGMQSDSNRETLVQNAFQRIVCDCVNTLCVTIMASV